MSGTNKQVGPKTRFSTKLETAPSLASWFRGPVTFPTGETFDQMLQPTNIFVDKTMLIAKVLNSAEALALTEPRRWGKSTNMSMLRLFFQKCIVRKGNHFVEISYRYLFERGKNTIINGKKETLPLAIAQDKQKWEEIYSQHQGAYPVIFMVWDIKCKTFDAFLEKMGERIALLFDQHSYILKDNKFGNKIADSWNIQYFQKICKRDIDLGKLDAYLLCLSRFLLQYHQKKVIFLIDEYDCVFNYMLQEQLKAKEKDRHILSQERKKVEDFIIDLLTVSIKSNPYKQRAVLTGISNFLIDGGSGLNCIQHHGVNDHQFSQFYGFTLKEIKQQLIEEMFKQIKQEDPKEKEKKEILESVYSNIKEWYNGYQVYKLGCGKLHIKLSNPYSIILYLKKIFSQQQVSKGDGYWTKSSNDNVLQAMFELQHKSIGKLISLNSSAATQLDYKSSLSMSSLQSFQKFNESYLALFLLNNGYITGSIDKDKNIISAVLPNRQVQIKFKEIIRQWALDTEHYNFAKGIVIDIEDKIQYKRIMEKHVLPNRKNILTTNECSVNSILAIAYVQSKAPSHNISIEVKSGSGRIDHLFTPAADGKGAVVIHGYKITQSPQNQQKCYFEALLQIYERNYFLKPIEDKKIYVTTKVIVRPIVVVKSLYAEDSDYLFMDDSKDICHTLEETQVLSSHPTFLKKTVEEIEKSQLMKSKRFDFQKAKEEFFSKIRTFLQDEQKKKLSVSVESNFNTPERSEKTRAIQMPSDRIMTPGTFNYSKAMISLLGSASLKKKSEDKNVQKNDRISKFKSKFQSSKDLYNCQREDLESIFGKEKAEQLYNNVKEMKADPLFYRKQQNTYDFKGRKSEENDEREEKGEKEERKKEENQERSSPKKEQPQQRKGKEEEEEEEEEQ